MTEICKYEAEIATMGQSIEYILKGVNDQNDKLDDLSKTLNGNGKTGLVTQTALNTDSLIRAWWFIGSVAGLMICAAIKTFFF